MNRKILFLIITFFSLLNSYSQESKLNIQDSEKIVSYFDSNYDPVMYWNSCDKNWEKTIYSGLSFRSERIENSELFNIYTSREISPIPFDENGYIGHTIIEISPLNVEYIYVYKNGIWSSIVTILNLKLYPCKTISNLPLPEFKSGKSLPTNEYGHIASTKNGSEMYIKVEERNSEFTEFWLKTTIPIKKVKNKSGKLTTTGGGHDLLLVKIYCKQNYYDIEKKLRYSKNGNVVSQDNVPEFQQRIIPETTLDIARDYICND
jgi:hypothetical protein